MSPYQRRSLKLDSDLKFGLNSLSSIKEVRDNKKECDRDTKDSRKPKISSAIQAFSPVINSGSGMTINEEGKQKN